MKLSLLSFLSVAVTTTVTAIDMPKLKSRLVVDDKDRGRGRVLSEFAAPGGECLTDIIDLDFAHSTLVASDLTTTTPMIFQGVDSAGLFDLWISIEAGSDYVPANAANNGFACAPPLPGDTGAPTVGCTTAPMVQLNLQQGRTTTFNFTLYETGTSTPAVIPDGKGIRFSVFDIDRGSAAGIETYIIDDWVTAIFVDNAPEEATFGVSTAPFNSLTASATSVGRGCDNPVDPFSLNNISCDNGAVDARKRSFMVEFLNTNTWKMLFSVSGTQPSGRNLLMAFCSELQDFCPNNNGRGAACGGDPHFQRWGVEARDTFHGECDLVLLHNKNLDIHVRTTIKDTWSYIEEVAIRIGSHVFEFTKNNDLLIDGKKTTLDNDEVYSIKGESSVTKSDKFYLLQEYKGRFVLKVKRTGMFHTISMDGLSGYLSQSRGLLGKYPSGSMMGRDGKLMNSFHEFSFEWQVNPEDPTLFHDAREPQLPFERCRVPSEAQMIQRRNLRGENDGLYKEAMARCTVSNKNSMNIELCIDDVMMTGDLDLAEMW